MLITLAQKQSLADGVLDGIGDLCSMPLPSARKQIIEQLDLLNAESDSEEPRREEKSEQDRLEGIKNGIVAKFNDCVHKLECFTQTDSQEKTLLAVVDHSDEAVKSRMEDVVQEHSQTSAPSPKIEVLDRATYELLERLAKAGIISIHADAAQALYRSEAADRVYQTQRQQLLTKAKQQLTEAERKIRMAQLLASGGFVIEALPPATEALESILKGYVILHKEPHREGSLLLQSIKADISTISEKNVSSMLELINTYFQELNLSIAKL